MLSANRLAIDNLWSHYSRNGEKPADLFAVLTKVHQLISAAGEGRYAFSGEDRLLGYETIYSAMNHTAHKAARPTDKPHWQLYSMAAHDLRDVHEKSENVELSYTKLASIVEGISGVQLQIEAHPDRSRHDALDKVRKAIIEDVIIDFSMTRPDLLGECLVRKSAAIQLLQVCNTHHDDQGIALADLILLTPWDISNTTLGRLAHMIAKQNSRTFQAQLNGNSITG